MRFFHPLYLLLLLLAALLITSAEKKGTKPLTPEDDFLKTDFLNLRRKYRRHCPKKRCLPLHSRVPFP
ncbi:apelin receptor early endogenous ligand [Triplophysa rosa]|uniref:apelin receptor early endogenous ligand n=1 Tax=Triplophysa rosa TaxID=992332 RepID=UPI002545FFF5|nr:apelin receptor early endogenous ligand [Triplophysa rosa]